MSEPAIFMNMCMVCRGDKVVVIDRKKQDWPGITFPGGKVENGESFVDSVIREIKEETGLTVSGLQLCGIKDWIKDHQRHVVLFYKATKVEGTLISSEEGEVWWEKLDELHTLDLAADMLEMVRVFTDESMSELYYRQEGQAWISELK